LIKVGVYFIIILAFLFKEAIDEKLQGTRKLSLKRRKEEAATFRGISEQSSEAILVLTKNDLKFKNRLFDK